MQRAQGEPGAEEVEERCRQVPQRWDELDSLVFPPLAHPPTVPAPGCTTTLSACSMAPGGPCACCAMAGRPVILHSQQALGESSSPHPECSEIWGEAQAEDSAYARMEV